MVNRSGFLGYFKNGQGNWECAMGLPHYYSTIIIIIIIIIIIQYYYAYYNYHYYHYYHHYCCYHGGWIGSAYVDCLQERELLILI